MNNKNRLYEIFSKVNKININEQLDVDQAKEELVDQVSQEITLDFRRNPKIFDAGIPYDLRLNIVGEEVNLKLAEEENGIILINGIDEQLQYNIIYNATIKGLAFKIKIPLTVEVEKIPEGDKINLKTKMWVVPNEIEITYNDF